MNIPTTIGNFIRGPRKLSESGTEKLKFPPFLSLPVVPCMLFFSSLDPLPLEIGPLNPDSVWGALPSGSGRSPAAECIWAQFIYKTANQNVHVFNDVKKCLNHATVCAKWHSIRKRGTRNGSIIGSCRINSAVPDFI